MRPLLLVLALHAAFAPTGAQAWTDAHVRSVRAHVEVQPEGRARVAMELLVRIHGGWLEGLEVAGLDPDLTLDEGKPPWAVSDDEPTLKFAPHARVDEEGRLSLSFRGRNASPRRGTVRVGFVYTTNLAHRATEGLSNGRVRVRWTLPPWRSGLDGVELALTVPPGAEQTAASTADRRAAVGFDRYALDDRTVFRWQRAHLPRTLAWTVEVDVPAESMSAELRAPPEPPRPKPRVLVGSRAEPSRAAPVVLVAALLLLVLLRRRTVARACRRAGAVPRSLVALPATLSTVAAVGCAAGAALVWADRPLLGLGLAAVLAVLSLDRAPALSAHAPRLGRFRAVRPVDLSRARRAVWARRLGLVTPVDLTTPAGIVLIATLGLAVHLAASDGQLGSDPTLLAGLLLLAVPALTGTRWQLPPTPELRVAALARHAARLRVDLGGVPIALALVVHADPQDRWQDARLRIVTPDAPAALVRLDVAIGDTVELGGVRSVLVALAVTRRGSTADAALGHALDAAREEHAGDRVARIAPIAGDLGQAVGRMARAALAGRAPTVESADREAA